MKLKILNNLTVVFYRFTHMTVFCDILATTIAIKIARVQFEVTLCKRNFGWICLIFLLMLIPVNFDICKFYTFKFRRQTYNELY